MGSMQGDYHKESILVDAPNLHIVAEWDVHVKFGDRCF